MSKMKLKKNNAFWRILKNPPLVISQVQTREIKRLISECKEDEKILNIGAKNIKFTKNTINLDLCSYGNVNVIGDAHELPFQDGAFSLVIITGLLEIVKNPQKVCREIYRVLKKGGKVMATVPFMQPYHPDPTDCQRFTIEGVRGLFVKFKTIRLGNTRGIFSMFAWFFRDFLAVLFSFNNVTLWKVWNIIFGWLLSPLKYLDYITPEFKQLHYISSSFLYVGEK